MSTSLWYFAYGSNLQRATFYGRRRMQPHAWRRARLDDHRLCFNLAIGAGERGVANLQAALGECVHGVAFHLDAEQFALLDRSEGVELGVYARVPVALRTEDDAALAAFTYVSPHVSADRKPSPRYLGLILEGAREHGLPEAYLRFLESFDLALDEREAR